MSRATLPDPVDLSQPGLIEQLVGACRSERQLPDATGLRVIITDIGRLSADAVTFERSLTPAAARERRRYSSAEPPSLSRRP